MTEADEAYVRDWYVTLEDVARWAGRDPDELRRLMLADRLPLPSYILPDGSQMVHADYLALLDAAGGPEELPSWFAAHWDDPTTGGEIWAEYLTGGFVCLKSVSPATIRAKDALVTAIDARLQRPAPRDLGWLEELHVMVDALDALEPPFAPYDRVRFGGPISRDRCIDDVRQTYPRPIAPSRSNQSPPALASPSCSTPSTPPDRSQIRSTRRSA
jgi:hypothetical protein